MEKDEYAEILVRLTFQPFPSCAFKKFILN